MHVKDHYEKHLAKHYAWMIDNFDQISEEFGSFLTRNQIKPNKSQLAVDLGAGNGIQSVALKKNGYEVIAIDFNEQLLKELRLHPSGGSIRTIVGDIRDASNLKNIKPELVVCCGDTLTHLESKKEIENLIRSYAAVLEEKGYMILSFRDYTQELLDEKRFIPVKSDENRILTCMLEYEAEKVKVTDLIHERRETDWEQQVSSYYKVRISPDAVVECLKSNGMEIVVEETIQGMIYLVANKK